MVPVILYFKSHCIYIVEISSCTVYSSSPLQNFNLHVCSMVCVLAIYNCRLFLGPSSRHWVCEVVPVYGLCNHSTEFSHIQQNTNTLQYGFLHQSNGIWYFGDWWFKVPRASVYLLPWQRMVRASVFPLLWQSFTYTDPCFHHWYIGIGFVISNQCPVACSGCDEGLMKCDGLGSDCCNFYLDDMCVEECPLENHVVDEDFNCVERTLHHYISIYHIC